MSEFDEEVPLCRCGKPCKHAGRYIQTTGTEYYVTCGDQACGKGRGKKRIPLRVGKKPIVKRFPSLTYSDKKCAMEGCDNQLGSQTGLSYYQQKSYCSNECRIKAIHKYNSEYYERSKILRDLNSQFLADVYADIRAGAVEADIRRKYGLDAGAVKWIMDWAISRRMSDIHRELEKRRKDETKRTTRTNRQ